jgi:hypothetical protein
MRWGKSVASIETLAGGDPFCYENGRDFEECGSSPAANHVNPIYQGSQLPDTVVQQTDPVIAGQQACSDFIASHSAADYRQVVDGIW